MEAAAALADLRDAVATTSLVLDVEGVEAARADRDALVRQADDYLLPRLRDLDAPLLAVIGGSTGAGKSTLVNSLLGEQVTQPGVLRPTTRAPVLVCHPADRPRFEDDRVLPQLSRTTGEAPAGEGTVHLVTSETLPPGLALLDAPDIDSVVAGNRALAAELLAAADLWIWVTTAARYADAVPWDLLAEAGERSAAVAVVLDRVPPDAVGDIQPDLQRMLDEHGVDVALLHAVREVPLVDGLLPESEVGPLRTWLEELGQDAGARAEVIRRTLEGALVDFERRAVDLAAAAGAQQEVEDRLRSHVREAYGDACRGVDASVRDGTLLRGEVLARWQEVVGTGELMRSVQSRISTLRDRLLAAARGRPSATAQVEEAVESGVASLVHAAADDAAVAAVTRWRREPAGRALLQGQEQALGRASVALLAELPAEVRAWQGEVLELVREEGADKRVAARIASYGVNGAGLVVMLAVFSQTAGLTGAEIAIAGGTTAAGQKLLEAFFGDQAVRTMAAQAWEDLLRRVDRLLDGDAERFGSLLDVGTTDHLDDAVGQVAGGAPVSRRSGGALDDRLAALEAAIQAGAGVVDEERLAPARATIQRAGGRLGHGVERTVVALAGATGSGKSSLFNAIVGEAVSTVGVRRPTTSRTSGAAWGSGGDALLDWLEVPSRHLVAAEPGDPLHGLVLLDLPDHDSTAAAHRAEVDRVVAVADLVVWVLDPQKYADAAVHEGYLQPLAAHGEVLLVVLNQADRLDDAALAACRTDLRRLLAEDGLPRLDVVATSTVTGAGIGELRDELAHRVRERRAAVDRLTADVTAAATSLGADCGGKAGRGGSRDQVVDALAEVAGVPAVRRAVAGSFRACGARRVGWPFTRWLGRLRPDPLRRLHLQREGGSAARTSLPPPSGVALARLRTAVRDAADGAAGELPPAWARALHDDAGAALEDVLPRLDATVAATDLDVRRDPRWWSIVAGLQWLLALAALFGAVWLGVLAVLGYLRLDALEPPDLGEVPLPTAMLLGGMVLGLLVSAVARWCVAVGARRRARRAERRLRHEVGALGDEVVLGRVASLTARHAEFCAALQAAGGAR